MANWDINAVNNSLADHQITISELQHHTKASESYINVEFNFSNGYKWTGLVPVQDNRKGIDIQSEVELVAYLVEIKPYFSEESVQQFKNTEAQYWKKTFPKADVTTQFFDKLIEIMQWVKPSDFPNNNNPARRIQDIKDAGYTIVTDPKKGRMMLPLPRNNAREYEVFSANLKNKIIKILKNTNVYELSSHKKDLLPDHKFPEIRWDENTPEENADTMTDDQIRKKFQLLNNQRNLQKREVCRSCFQTKERGIIFGIKFFYQGTPQWDSNIPEKGKEAEPGCIGCAWYDIEEWRKKLNEYIDSTQK